MMNTFCKMLLAAMFSTAMLTAAAQGPKPSGPHPHGPALAGLPSMAPDGHHHPNHDMHMQALPPMEFQSTKICYAPQMGCFVVVDSAECAIHLVARIGDRMDTIGRYITDNTYKRHDLKNILRPVSVSMIEDRIVFLASATADSSYLGVLDLHPNAKKELRLVARRGFGCRSYALRPNRDELIVAGINPLGYDINIVSLRGGLDHIGKAPVQNFHFRIPKQSEMIQHSDPIGIGLTAVAVAVVFLALICIALILQGSGKLMSGVGKKEKKSDGPKASSPAPQAKDDEVIAAIAAAIHLYNDELHDEEDGVITIQKVEREWTPWNAKYYNMNHYFNNRK